MAMMVDSHKNTQTVGGPRPYRSVESFNHDGVELARLRHHRREWPVRQVLLFLLAVVSFKIFLFLNLGGAVYGAKMTELAHGGPFERMASAVMVLDPVSEFIVKGVTFGIW